MKKKIIGILVMTLLIASGFGSVFGNAVKVKTDMNESVKTERFFEINKVKNEKSEGESKSLNIDLDVYYYITAKDHPDVLDDSSIDNIAFITLFSEKDLLISIIEILISTDEKTWLETDIVEDGIWHSGEKITIREITSNEVVSSYYMVRVSTIENKIPLAQCVVNIDNAPLESFNLFKLNDDRFDDTISVTIEGNAENTFNGEDPPDEAASNCHYETMGILYFAAALGVEYDGKFYDPNPYGGVWIYKFKVDAVFSDEKVGFCDRMQLYIEDVSGVLQPIATPHTGGWHMDEDLGDAYDEEAKIVCTIAVTCINYLPLTFAWTGIQVADFLMDRSEPYLEWVGPINEYYSEASAYCYQYIFVPPETSWEMKYNLKVHDAYPPPDGIWIDLKNDGEGRILISGTSPPPEEGDLIAQDVWMSSQAEDWDKDHVVDVPDEGEDVWFHFEYDWTGTETCPTHHVQIRLDGSVQCEGDMSDVSGGHTVKICCSSPWTAVPGDYTLTGETDTNNNVPESNENNNVATYTFTVPSGECTIEITYPEIGHWCTERICIPVGILEGLNWGLVRASRLKCETETTGSIDKVVFYVECITGYSDEQTDESPPFECIFRSNLPNALAYTITATAYYNNQNVAMDEVGPICFWKK